MWLGSWTSVPAPGPAAACRHPSSGVACAHLEASHHLWHAPLCLGLCHRPPVSEPRLSLDSLTTPTISHGGCSVSPVPEASARRSFPPACGGLAPGSCGTCRSPGRAQAPLSSQQPQRQPKARRQQTWEQVFSRRTDQGSVSRGTRDPSGKAAFPRDSELKGVRGRSSLSFLGPGPGRAAQAARRAASSAGPARAL